MTIIEQKQILILAQEDATKNYLKTCISNLQQIKIDALHNMQSDKQHYILFRNYVEEKIKIYRGLLASLNSLTTKATINNG